MNDGLENWQNTTGAIGRDVRTCTYTGKNNVTAQACISRAWPALLVVAMLTTPVQASDLLDGITITAPADGQQRTGEVVAEESAVARHTIPVERFTETNASLGAVLSRSVGTQARGAGGFGSVETLSIRAGTSAQTGVYLDGIRLNGAGNPSFDFATLEALNLSSIDVYRGGTPLALGGGDIGGAVNLRTPTGGTDTTKARQDGTLGISGGSFGARGAHVSGSASRGQWFALGAISTREADNNYRVTDNNGTRFNTTDDSREDRLNADVSRQALLGRLLYRVSDKREASVLVQATARDSGVPTPRNNEGNDARFSDDTTSVHLTHTARQLGSWNTRQTLYHHTLDYLYNDRDGDVGLGVQSTDSANTTLGTKFFAEHVDDTGSLSLILDAREENLDQRDLIRGARNLEGRRFEYTLLSSYALWLPGDTLVLTPGVEWRRTRDRVRVTTEAAALRGAPEKTEERAFMQSLGMRAELGRGFSLRANAARVQRSPSFTELFGDSGLLLANSLLIPERGSNIDLALAWQDTPANPRHRISVGVFTSDRDQLITTVFDSRGVGRAENIGEARAHGVELEVASALTRTITLDGNLTWQDTEQITELDSTDGKQLPGQATVVLGARLEWAYGQWRSWYGVDHERDRFYDTGNLLRAPDNTVQHAGLQWQQKPFTVSFSLDNIGDVVVEDFRGFPRPGRSAYLAVKLTL